MKILIGFMSLFIAVTSELHANDATDAQDALALYAPLQVGVFEQILSVIPSEHVDSQIAVEMIHGGLSPYVFLGEAKFYDFDTIKIGPHYFDFGIPFGAWFNQREKLKPDEFIAEIRATLRR